MAVDEQRIREFILERLSRQEIAAVVRAAGYRIVWVVERSPEQWGFYLKPNKDLSSLFGSQLEVLLWCAEYDEFQARSVSEPYQHILELRPRLSEDFAIVITMNKNTREHVEATSSNLPIRFVGLSREDIRTSSPHGGRDFVQLLQNQLFTKDIYWVQKAIQTSNGFFGRSKMLAEMVENLRTSSAHVGLFGLRKMGKTSFLYRLSDELRRTGDVFVVHTDLQLIESVYPEGEYLLWRIGEAMYDSYSQIRRLSGMKLFGRYTLYAEIDKKLVWELFRHDISLILKLTSKKICLLIDEAGLMLPSGVTSKWSDSFVRVWRLLRGIDQETPGRISYCIADTNPSCIETPKVGSDDNPIFNSFKKMFLPPFDLLGCTELLTSIGRRVGLEWDEASVKEIYSHVGGHPQLLRGFGSRVHRALLPRERIVSVTVKSVRDQLDNFLLDAGATLSQITGAIEEDYPNEYYLLDQLALGRIGEFRELSAAFPDDASHLVGYGLIDDPGSASRLNIDVLQTWLQRRARAKRANPIRVNLADFLPGDPFEGYTIHSQLGRSGGFATVFRATPPASSTEVALKILHVGSFPSLQREMDALSNISHSAIVRFIDHGRATDGKLYIVMEYLAGKVLSDFCQRSARMPEDEATLCLEQLLEALIALHPDPTAREQLRSRDEIDSEEFARLLASQQGYIHRDIKPENIVLVVGRGPVLIDFNISTRASDPVLTMSGTPGYMPPDGAGQVWSPDVDIYQLGLTMLQVALGRDIPSSSPDDLRAAARTELATPGLRDVLLRMTAATRVERFASANAALGALRKRASPRSA